MAFVMLTLSNFVYVIVTENRVRHNREELDGNGAART